MVNGGPEKEPGECDGDGTSKLHGIVVAERLGVLIEVLTGGWNNYRLQDGGLIDVMMTKLEMKK